MSTKNELEREELRREIESSTEVSAVSGTELRELIRSKGGIRAVQELLMQHRGVQPSTQPTEPDAARLRELARLLAKQHAAEHLDKGGQS